MQSEEKITSNEVRFLMVGGTYSDFNKEKPKFQWMTKKIWATICEATDFF